MDWQAIETAPKDGTPFIGYSETEGVEECFWDKRVGMFLSPSEALLYSETGECCYGHLTHWQPLPAPPQTQEEPRG